MRLHSDDAKQIPHRLGEGEGSTVGSRIQPILKRQETVLAVPSPVGRELHIGEIPWGDYRDSTRTMFRPNVGVMKDDKVPQTGASPGAQVRCPTTPRSRILVVDDDVAFRMLSAEVLVGSGYQVDTAEDGIAAWATLHANGYDLLITDNNIRKVSGVELVKEMRCARMTLPVILASGELPLEELDRNPWLQPVATLAKPFTGGQLLETVNQVLADSTIPPVGTHCRRGTRAERLLQPAARMEPPQGLLTTP